MNLRFELMLLFLLPLGLAIACKHSDPAATRDAATEVQKIPGAGSCTSDQIAGIQLDCNERTASTEALPWQAAPLQRDNPPYMTIARWCDITKCQLIHPIRPETELAFIGDSIMLGWSDQAKDSWNQNFGKYSPLQLAIGGDKSENVIWRINKGALQDLPKLKTLIVFVGANNIGWHVPGQDCAKGIIQVAKAAHEAKKDLRVLVLGLLPREAKDPKLSENILLANKILEANADTGDYEFKNFHDLFLVNGKVNPELMSGDLVHPNKAGYEVLSKALAPLL